MKEREIACQYYQFEKSCSIGKEGTFWKSCQHCSKYVPIKGGKPARKNLKKEKIQKAIDRENNR